MLTMDTVNKIENIIDGFLPGDYFTIGKGSGASVFKEASAIDIGDIKTVDDINELNNTYCLNNADFQKPLSSGTVINKKEEKKDPDNPNPPKTPTSELKDNVWNNGKYKKFVDEFLSNAKIS